MASIERTAYPRLTRHLSPHELSTHYTPSSADLAFADSTARGAAPTLTVLLLLKTFERLGYFPRLSDVPLAVMQHLRVALCLPADLTPEVTPRTLYRYHQAIRAHLHVTPYDRQARHLITRAIYEAAQAKDNPADLINVAIEELIRVRCELPAFGTLDRLARRIRTLVNRRYFLGVVGRLPEAECVRLNGLLETIAASERTPYHALKQQPKRPSRSHLHELLDHSVWLDAFGAVGQYLIDLPPLKRQHFAAECKALDAAELKDVALPKRLTLILCLIEQTQVQARDDLAEMCIKRLRRIHTQGKEELEQVRARQQETTEQLVGTLADVLGVVDDERSDGEVGGAIRQVLAERGSVQQLLLDCEAVSAYNGNNYLPLLWRFFRAHRSGLFRLARTLQLQSTSQDQTLMQALAVALEHQDRDSKYLAVSVDFSFASEQWQHTVLVRKGRSKRVLRRAFEVCVFTYLAADLTSGDVAVIGSGAYSDYREQLLPWEECAPLVAGYCAQLGLPETAATFVAGLKEQLAAIAARVDADVPTNEHLEITAQGEPVLKRPPRAAPDPEVTRLEAAILARLPERTLLEVLGNVQHWTGWTRHFGPLSGSDPKLDRPIERYILTTFAYGSNLGPVQAARHLGGAITPHMVSFVNRRHVTTTKLEAAQRDLIDTYARFGLPTYWGDGTTAAADGTKYTLTEETLLSVYHIRYGGYGGIAYHHVSDRYVALFSHFIPCGVWEAIYIIDGLLKNTSVLQPTAIHADTQGQAAPVFAFAHLLGIKLLPRIRNWKDLTFFRPDQDSHYQHIDALFSEVVDWDLIATHWQDLFQVVLSIQAGKISSATLLRKLGTYSRKNRLYLAAREVGRVIRTIFLLEYLSNVKLRQEITASTNKVEAYNGFAKFLFFGGEGVVGEHDRDEQEKCIKYNDLVANAVIFQNVVDMTYALRDLIREGYPVQRAAVAGLSPYITRNLKRFGEYAVNLDVTPTPLDGEMALPLQEPGETKAEEPA
jgi:TnpA family transposase